MISIPRVIYPPAPPPLHIAERPFMLLVIDLARFCGWWAWHDEDSRRNEAGLPDLLLVRERIIWRELKTQRGKVRPAQAMVGERIIEAGGDWGIWRPGSWGEIVATLTAEISQQDRQNGTIESTK